MIQFFGGVALIAASSGLFIFGLQRTLRRNRGIRLPMWGNAPREARHTLTLRGVAAVLMGFGGQLAVGGERWWAVLLVLVPLTVLVALLLRHNRAVAHG